MVIKSKDIYDGRRKRSHPVRNLVIVFSSLLVLAVALFYGLKARCVYDDSGMARIILPFTQQAQELKEARAQLKQEKKSWEITQPAHPLNPGDAADEPAVPGDTPATPGDDLTSPGDDPAAPGDDPAVPGDDPAVPGDEPATPGDVPLAPDDAPVSHQGGV